MKKCYIFFAGYVYEPAPMIKSLTTVISLFIHLLQCSCKKLLVYHTMVKKCTLKRLQTSPLGILFQEFSIYIILLQNYAPIITSNCETFAQFAEILDWFDKFNRCFPENDPEQLKKDEDSELAWPNLGMLKKPLDLVFSIFFFLLISIFIYFVLSFSDISKIDS